MIDLARSGELLSIAGAGPCINLSPIQGAPPHPDSDPENAPPRHLTMPTTPSQPRRILITAGPTHEPIDRVRYLANRSSGRMGVALAEAAADRGWPVMLLLGPAPTPPPERSDIRTLRFQSTEELSQLLDAHWPHHDILIMAAAVADYRPAEPARAKLKRTGEPITLTLHPTPDLLAQAAANRRDGQVVIGFALEPADQLIESAQAKLRRKGADAIVANPLKTMDSSHITATIVLPDREPIPAQPNLEKPAFARWLLDQLSAIAPHLRT